PSTRSRSPARSTASCAGIRADSDGGLMSLNRRQWLGRLAAGAAGLALPARRAAAEPGLPQEASAKASDACPLALKDFQPKSMLHVSETKVPRARFPVIDIHTH